MSSRCAELIDIERKTKKAEEPLSWDDIASCARRPRKRRGGTLRRMTFLFWRNELELGKNTTRRSHRELAWSAGSRKRDDKSRQEEGHTRLKKSVAGRQQSGDEK